MKTMRERERDKERDKERDREREMYDPIMIVTVKKFL